MKRFLATLLVCGLGGLALHAGTARADVTNLNVSASSNSIVVSGTSDCLIGGPVLVEVWDDATWAGVLFQYIVVPGPDFTVTFPSSDAFNIGPESFLRPNTDYNVGVDDSCSATGIYQLRTGTVSAAVPQPPGRAGYCAVAGNKNPYTGAAYAPGTFLDLTLGQPDTDDNFKGATTANYYQGIGLSCDPDPGGYKDTGTKVDQTGQLASLLAGGIYDYYTKS